MPKSHLQEWLFCLLLCVLLSACEREPRLLKLHGPVGLDIGAESPAEISLSIAAQVIRHWRKPSSPDSER